MRNCRNYYQNHFFWLRFIFNIFYTRGFQDPPEKNHPTYSANFHTKSWFDLSPSYINVLKNKLTSPHNPYIFVYMVHHFILLWFNPFDLKVDREGVVVRALLCHSCGCSCQRRVLKTFRGPGYIRSEDGAFTGKFVYIYIYIYKHGFMDSMLNWISRILNISAFLVRLFLWNFYAVGRS